MWSAIFSMLSTRLRKLNTTLRFARIVFAMQTIHSTPLTKHQVPTLMIQGKQIVTEQDFEVFLEEVGDDPTVLALAEMTLQVAMDGFPETTRVFRYSRHRYEIWDMYVNMMRMLKARTES